MKTNDALGTVVGTSHRRIARVDIYDGNTPLYQDIPVTEGRVVAAATEYDRWGADLSLAGDLFMPTDPTDPLSGFAGTHLRIFMGAEVDTVDELIEVCRVVPVNARTVRSVESTTTEVRCVGPAGWMDTLNADYDNTGVTTCQDLIVQVVTDTNPPAWDGTFSDGTTGVSIPADYESDGATAWQIVEDMCAIANVTAYFDALGTLIIRGPMSSSPGTAVETIAVGTDLAEYDNEVGRGFGFANQVRLRFTNPADDTEVVGKASQFTGPFAISGPTGQVTYTENRQGKPSQAQANARAAALLSGLLQAWQTTIVRAVPDPRLEPDDTITLELDDRTLTGRLTRVELPLSPTELMIVGVRTY